jgi:DNA-binding MarR family transcriptional regulator
MWSDQGAYRVVRHRDEASRDAAGAAGGDMFVLEESLGYLAQLLARDFRRVLARCLAQHGVASGQWPVLLALWERDGQSQKALSLQVGVEGPTMVRTLDRMERDDLVRRVPDPRDRRRFHVRLTERGRALRDVLVPCALAGNAAATRSFTAAERSQAHLLVKRMVAALEAALSDAEDGSAPSQA